MLLTWNQMEVSLLVRLLIILLTCNKIIETSDYSQINNIRSYFANQSKYPSKKKASLEHPEAIEVD